MDRKIAESLAKNDGPLLEALKMATLGMVNSVSKNVGRFSGMQTAHALKAPGVAASTQAVNPRRSISNAINASKP